MWLTGAYFEIDTDGQAYWDGIDVFYGATTYFRLTLRNTGVGIVVLNFVPGSSVRSRTASRLRKGLGRWHLSSGFVRLREHHAGAVYEICFHGCGIRADEFLVVRQWISQVNLV